MCDVKVSVGVFHYWTLLQICCQTDPSLLSPFTCSKAMELRCRKGCMDPMPPIVPGEPFPRRSRAVKFGPHCYAPRRPKVCRIHHRVLFGPGCDCNQYYHGKRTSDEERRCAAGCLTSAGQRAIKYGDDCSCIDARQKPGYSPSTCHCGGSSCSNCNALPVLDPRTRHAESRRYARAMDRKLPPPVPSLHSMPLDEYVQLPFELRASMKKAEERTRNRTNAVSFAVGRAKLWEYLDPMLPKVFRPVYRDEPLAQAFDLWCCPVSLSQSNPFKPPSICGMIIDLRQISNDLVWHSRHSEPSLVLMETKLSRAFNEAICSHLRQHMNSFGLDFDSHGCPEGHMNSYSGSGSCGEAAEERVEGEAMDVGGREERTATDRLYAPAHCDRGMEFTPRRAVRESGPVVTSKENRHRQTICHAPNEKYFAPLAFVWRKASEMFLFTFSIERYSARTETRHLFRSSSKEAAPLLIPAGTRFAFTTMLIRRRPATSTLNRPPSLPQSKRVSLRLTALESSRENPYGIQYSAPDFVPVEAPRRQLGLRLPASPPYPTFATAVNLASHVAPSLYRLGFFPLCLSWIVRILAPHRHLPSYPLGPMSSLVSWPDSLPRVANWQSGSEFSAKIGLDKSQGHILTTCFAFNFEFCIDASPKLHVIAKSNTVAATLPLRPKATSTSRFNFDLAP
ncbi:hypothetical protein K438DRAFT_1940531 [Mycena galopus ATCC 62051]|nr:hypothetical protein K438DRAFT_1940531 [Mycena galopus ATCC 62051]